MTHKAPHFLHHPHHNCIHSTPLQGQYRKQLAELDASLAAALPRDGVPFRTHDLVYKSSGTPVRFLFEVRAINKCMSER